MAEFIDERKVVPFSEAALARASGAYHPETGARLRNNVPRVTEDRIAYNVWEPKVYFEFPGSETRMTYDATGDPLNNLIDRQAEFETNFPQFTIVNLGFSFTGRVIRSYRLGPVTRKHCVFIGGVHGNEIDGINGMFKAAEILATETEFQPFRDEWTLFFIPALNPDGWFLNTRNTAETGPNGRTVNLNRNFDWFWDEYVETSLESKGSAPESTPEAQTLLDYFRTGDAGGPVTFGFLLDFHANQGVGARYQSRDRIWRGIAQQPGFGSGPLPANNTAVFLDVYIWRHLLALTRKRAETTTSGPDSFVRYFRSRFRPHLHSYFSSQGIPSIAAEEVKVDFANGRETFQTAANFRVDYCITIAALLTQSFWRFEDAALIEKGGTNLLNNAEWEQWQSGDERPGFWTTSRSDITRLQHIPEVQEAAPGDRFLDDSGEALRLTSDTDVLLPNSSEFTRAARDGPTSYVVISQQMAGLFRFDNDAAFNAGIINTLTHSQRTGTALAATIGTNAIDIFGGGTAAPSTGAVTTVSRVTGTDLASPSEGVTGNLNTARMFHAVADNFEASPISGNERAYVFGGFNNAGTRLDTIEIWNPNTSTPTNSVDTLPVALADAVAVYHPPTNNVYIFGGSTGVAAAITTIVEYDVTGDSITTQSAVLPTALKHLAGAYSTADGKIWLAGGEDASGNMSASILTYDPVADSITVEAVDQNLTDDEDDEETGDNPWSILIGRHSGVFLPGDAGEPNIVLPGGRINDTSGALLDEIYQLDTGDKIIGLPRESDYGYVRFSTPISDDQYAPEVTDDFLNGLDESQAAVLSATAETYDFNAINSGGDVEFGVIVDGGTEQTVLLRPSDFSNFAAGLASEVAARVNASVAGATASDSSGSVLIQSDTSGGSSAIQVQDGDSGENANSALGFVITKQTFWSDPNGAWEAGTGTVEGGNNTSGPLILQGIPGKDNHNQRVTLDVGKDSTAEAPDFAVTLRGAYSGATLTDGYRARYDDSSQDWILERLVASSATTLATLDVSSDEPRRIIDSTRPLIFEVEELDPVHLVLTFNSLSIFDEFDFSSARIKAEGQVAIEGGETA